MLQKSLGTRTALACALAFAACRADPEGPPGAAPVSPDGPDAAIDRGTQAPDAPPPSGPTALVYAGGGHTINVFRAGLTTGALSFLGTAAAGDDARYADLDAQGRHLYVQTQLGKPYAILTFDLEPPGTLNRTGELAFPYPMIEGVSQVLLHPTAPWFLISVSDRLAGLEDHLMPIGPDGRLGAARLLAREFYGFDWDPTGKYFYGFDGVAISQYLFDPASGSIMPNIPPKSEGSTGHQVLRLKTHPGGKWAYAVEEDAIGLFSFDATGGPLSAPTYLPGPVSAEPAYWTSIALASSGRFLFAVGYVADTEIALIDVFSVDPASGVLQFVEREKGDSLHQLLDTGLQAPLILGDLLIVGGKSTADRFNGAPVLNVYRVSEADGTLEPVGDPTPLQPAEGTSVNFILGAPR